MQKKTHENRYKFDRFDQKIIKSINYKLILQLF